MHKFLSLPPPLAARIASAASARGLQPQDLIYEVLHQHFPCPALPHLAPPPATDPVVSAVKRCIPFGDSFRVLTRTLGAEAFVGGPLTLPMVRSYLWGSRLPPAWAIAHIHRAFQTLAPDLAAPFLVVALNPRSQRVRDQVEALLTADNPV